jgi:hypothetical protein
MITLWQGNPALKWGLIFGLPLGVLGAINTLLLFKGAPGVGNLPQFVVVMVIFFAAGLLAARETGEVAKGGLAGLIGATLATALSGLLDVVLVLVAPRAYAFMAGFDKLGNQPGTLLLTVIFGLLISLIVYAAFGCAVGALGGLAGRRLAPPAAGASPQSGGQRSA